LPLKTGAQSPTPRVRLALRAPTCDRRIVSAPSMTPATAGLNAWRVLGDDLAFVRTVEDGAGP
ncbi:hypothetical protein, partial [Asaia bogorensis]|uniref:hypothetical protein n=1 Tax=Asaia bogorensis TaxID=91915 RepID=UPI0022329435